MFTQNYQTFSATPRETQSFIILSSCSSAFTLTNISISLLNHVTAVHGFEALTQIRGSRFTDLRFSSSLIETYGSFVLVTLIHASEAYSRSLISILTQVYQIHAIQFGSLENFASRLLVFLF